MATIKKGGTRKIRTNFNESELQSGSWRGGYSDTQPSFELSDNTLDALQWVREFLDTIIKIRSTARSPQHNHNVGSYPSSMHYWDGSKTIRAIDFTIPDEDLFNVLYWDIRNKGIIYKTFRERFGLSIGMYNTFFHIDDGKGVGVSPSSQHTDKYGKFGLWDTTTEKKNLNESLYNSIQARKPKLFISTKTRKKIIVAVLIILVIALIFFMYKTFKK